MIDGTDPADVLPDRCANAAHDARRRSAAHCEPALTKSVQRLESELGVPLIARKGRGIALTPYGQRLADELQQPLNQLRTFRK